MTIAALATDARNELLCWSATREAAGALTFLITAHAAWAVGRRRAQVTIVYAAMEVEAAEQRMRRAHLARCLAVMDEAAEAVDDAPLTVEVPSDTRPGVVYVVALDGSRCSCPGFTFRGYCKHVAPMTRQAA